MPLFMTEGTTKSCLITSQSQKLHLEKTAIVEKDAIKKVALENRHSILFLAMLPKALAYMI